MLPPAMRILDHNMDGKLKYHLFLISTIDRA